MCKFLRFIHVRRNHLTFPYFHNIEDTEVIILKKENKEKGSVAHAKYTNWPPLSHRGTLNKSFIHRRNARQQTEDKM
jgi:hypothetical protein